MILTLAIAATRTDQARSFADFLSRAGYRAARRMRVMRARRRRVQALLRAEDARIDALPHIPSPTLVPGLPRQMISHDNFR